MTKKRRYGAGQVHGGRVYFTGIYVFDTAYMYHEFTSEIVAREALVKPSAGKLYIDFKNADNVFGKSRRYGQNFF